MKANTNKIHCIVVFYFIKRSLTVNRRQEIWPDFDEEPFQIITCTNKKGSSNSVWD